MDIKESYLYRKAHSVRQMQLAMPHITMEI